jgi:hypothetical protein
MRPALGHADITCDEMTLDAWTAMLYKEEATVRVLTVAAFLLARATKASQLTSNWDYSPYRA